MIYPFKCQCGHYDEVWRPVSECNNDLICPLCNRGMVRVFTVPQINIPTMDPGKKREFMRRKAADGEPVVEVGNEDLSKVTPRNDWSFSDTQQREMHSMLESVENP